ncbi:hypothetical protein ES703_74212 [subsurface metagenome]
MKQVYLLTGKPGTGKTSLIKQAIAGMRGKAGGFYTEEIRSGGVREGFRLVTLDGQDAILAHIDIHIGKMELFSANFREAIWQIINSGKKVLGTIMFKANPWADAIKRQPQVNLVEVTRANYQRVLEELLVWLEVDQSSS